MVPTLAGGPLPVALTLVPLHGVLGVLNPVDPQEALRGELRKQ